MGAYTYDPQKVSFVLGGQIASGFVDGTFITITPDEALWQKVVGADGKVSRSKTANEAAVATLTLAQTSPFNDILSALLALDKVSGAGVVPGIVKDGSGTTLVSTGAAWVQGPPAITYGKVIENREWTIDFGKTIFFVGGNTDSDA